MIKKQHHLSGFTLSELLIVIALIAILAVSAIVAINPMAQIHKAFDARRKADINHIQTAMESYYSDHGSYPPMPVKDAEDHFTYFCDSDILSPYLKKMPCDPNTKEPYTIWYIPKASSSAISYAIFAKSNSFYDAQSSDNSYISLVTENPYCPGLFIVHSPNITDAQVIEGCSGLGLATNLYGCINGSCQNIYAAGICSPNYDTPTCGRSTSADAAAWCSLPVNACQ